MVQTMTQYTVTFAVVVTANDREKAREKAIKHLHKKDNRKRAFTEIYNHSNGTSYY